jgi:D-psicose/D-tagatose/L-ribulose 3-epimerase
MKLAVSNIAWPREQDAAVADLLVSHGVSGIEVAPTKLWNDPTAATDAEIDACRRTWEARGLPIVAAQALLFGRPELTLFDAADGRERTIAYLSRIIRLCGRLGAKALVFGSPKNRLIGSRDRSVVWPIAVEAFTRLGETAVAESTCVVMEANPPDYGADFVTRASDAIDLVRAVNHLGFRLHLDTACMTLAGDPPSSIAAGIDMLRHFHVSEPQLGVVGRGSVRHAEFATVLHECGYDGWVSIEMRENQPFSLDVLAEAIDFTTRSYSEPLAG